MSRFISPAYRAEAVANLRLALPLIAAQIAAVGMGTIDTIYAGQVGPRALAAVAVAVNVYNLFLIFFMGLLMACSPITAQMFGARRPAAELGGFLRRSQRFGVVAGVLWTGLLNLTGPIVLHQLNLSPETTDEAIGFLRRSQRFGVVAGVLWTGLLNLTGPIVLHQLNLSPETTDEAIGFLRWFSMAGFMTAIWFVLRFSAEGMGQVRPIVIAGLIGLAANALFGWLLVFGHAGLPALGINGLGLASTLATALMVAVLGWQYTRVPVLREAMQASRDRLAAVGEGAGDILKLGLPIAAIITAEGGLFVLMALLMARFGETTVASYQVAINFSSLVFMIPLGVGMATTVRVGHAAGAGDHAAARWRGLVGLSIGTMNAASNAAIMLLFTALIISLYTADPVIAAQAGGFLLISAAFQLFDGVQATANGALRGLKDTRMPMLLTLVSYWGIGMPVAWWLAFRLDHGPDGLWWGLTAGLAAAAFGLTLRFAYKSAKLVRRAPAVGLAEA